MPEVARKTISFNSSEVAAVTEVLEDPAARSILNHQLGPFQRSVCVAGGPLPADEIDGSSLSDVVRGLVRIGLCVVDRERLARQYQLAAPVMAQLLADPAVADLAASSDRVVSGAAQANLKSELVTGNS